MAGIKIINEDGSSARKDTGRTDKYSDENPSKDYKDYRADYPNDKKEPRKIEHDITIKKRDPVFVGPKSVEVRKQELIAHIQNYQETFDNQQTKAWKIKFKELTEALG